MTQAPTIDRLLNLVPDSPSSVISHLQANPQLASKQDAHGYSLLHAATSYEHLDLLKTLIKDYHVDPNITDEDGETCLFNAESVDFARELVGLGVKIDHQNDEGQTAAEKLDDDEEQPQVAAYLKQTASQPAGSFDAASSQATHSTHLTNGNANGVHAPPPMPSGVQVNLGTMQENEIGDEPDAEFRRRIEELASREDFQGEEGQRQLRDLVSDVVSGINNEGQGPASSRRRLR